MFAIRKSRMIGYNRRMMLKPQDVLICLKIALVGGQDWSYQSLADALFLSPSEAHAGAKRAEAARLLDLRRKTVYRSALTEFLIHGVRYAYPPQRGGLTRGVPTGYAAPPLARQFSSVQGDPPVWPTPEGRVRGYEFSPLYPSVPKAAAKDEQLYELLALVDAIRDGRARESGLAAGELKARLCEPHAALPEPVIPEPTLSVPDPVMQA